MWSEILALSLLVDVFLQPLTNTLAVAPLAAPVHISVVFNKLNGIKVGAPVLAQGQTIGTVNDIVSDDSAGGGRKESEKNDYRVVVKISPEHRSLLRSGTVALISCPLTAQTNEAETVVELFIPKCGPERVLNSGEQISGFSSYEDFWSSGDLSCEVSASGKRQG